MSGREWPATVTLVRDVCDGPGVPPHLMTDDNRAHIEEYANEFETASYVPSQPVQGLVEALEEVVAGSDELFATNRARSLRSATVLARKALADYKNNTEEA